MLAQYEKLVAGEPPDGWAGAIVCADGEIVGGVGVSAGTVEEDHQVADAGRAAYSGARG